MNYMRRDSIRRNETKEDMITTLRMELSADIFHKKSILLVEGSDDVKFAKKVCDRDVVCYESFSGKEGLEELIEDPDIRDERIIAVRDRDYCDIEMLPERMFAYDACCLELMLIKSKEVEEGLYLTYYTGNLSQDRMVPNALRQLAPLSLLRKANEEQKMGIPLASIGFGDLIRREEDFDMEPLFLRIKKMCKNIISGNANELDRIIDECTQESEHIGDEQLYELTNGHDLCLFLGVFLKSGGKCLGEKGTRDAMLNSYRKSDFIKTDLYAALKEYQEQFCLHFV